MKTLNINVSSSEVLKTGTFSLIQHEVNVGKIVATFSPEWEDLTKVVTFYDAKGEKAVPVPMLEENGVFFAVIPPDTTVYGGNACFVIDGYKVKTVEDGKEILDFVIRTKPVFIKIYEAPERGEGEALRISPTDYERLLNLINALSDKVGKGAEEMIQTAIEQVINGAPEALDTLNELSKALGDDPNFATTVLESLGKKAGKENLVGEKDNPFGAEIFNDYENNETNIPFAHIEGRNNKAVIKCFMITENTENSVTLDSVEGIEVGMVWNIFTPSETEIYDKYRGKITAIDGNAVMLDNIVNDNAYLPNVVSEKASFLNTFIVNGGTIGSTVIEDDELKAFTTHIAGEDCIGYLDTITGGRGCEALAYAAIAIGYFTKVRGDHGAAFNYETEANGFESFAINCRTKANGRCSFAGGSGSVADANFSAVLGSYCRTEKGALHSHAINLYTIATAVAQFVHGKYNIEDVKKEFAHIVGNGTSDENRSNAYTLDWDGNGHFAGRVRVGKDKELLPTQKEVDEKKADILIKNTETSKLLNINDSSRNIIPALNIYGESIQEGTPTPETPIEVICAENPTLKIINEEFVKATATDYALTKADTKYEDETLTNVLTIPQGGAVHYKFSGITGVDMEQADQNQGLMIRCKWDGITAGAYILLGNFKGSKPLSIRKSPPSETGTASYPCIEDLTKPFEILIKNTGAGENPIEYFISTDGGNTFSLIVAQGYSKNETPSMQTYGNVSTTLTEAIVYTDSKAESLMQTVTIPYTLMGLKNKNGVFEARDEIIVDDGKVKLIQRCNKFVITNSTALTVGMGVSNNGLYYRNGFSLTPAMKKGSQLAGYGSFMPSNLYGWSTWNAETLHFGQANAMIYLITASQYGSKEELYNYLSNGGENEPYVIYQLATPTETDITDTPCGQALLKLYTNYPRTVIFCDTDCAVSYKADTTNAYNNLLGELDTLKQAIINLGGTI